MNRDERIRNAKRSAIQLGTAQRERRELEAEEARRERIESIEADRQHERTYEGEFSEEAFTPPSVRRRLEQSAARDSQAELDAIDGNTHDDEILADMDAAAKLVRDGK